MHITRFSVLVLLTLSIVCWGCDDSDSLVDRDGEGGSGGAGGTGGSGGSEPGAVCGNGVIEAGEACEGDDLDGRSCQTEGFDAGALRCGSGCQLATTACSRNENCNNGIDDDGDGRIDCADSDCDQVAPCPRCGDGLVNRDEHCDGTELDGASCSSLGFDVGTLSCSAACTFDTTACAHLEQCANGRDDDGDGLVDCDDPDCDQVAPCPRCGDGLINIAGEECDGATIETTCLDLGFSLGETTCSDVCTLDNSACGHAEDCETPGDEDEDGLADCDDPDCATAHGCPFCGNDVIQAGEDCDGTALPACQDFGFDTGAVACSADCQADTSGCRDFVCGDGLVEGAERCDDGNPDLGDGCTPGCLIEGDVCAAPLELTWDEDEAAWTVVADTTILFPDYAASCADTTDVPDAVATFTAPATGTYRAAVDAAFDAILFAWRGACGGPGTEIDCGNDHPAGNQEAFEFDLQEGETIFLVVSGDGGWGIPALNAGPFVLYVAPIICGDGILVGPEQCDDGNIATGDGCDATCRWEGDSCGDVFDLNLNGTNAVALAGEYWFWYDEPMGWMASTALFANDFIASSCGSGSARDGIARFTAPSSGTYLFSLYATFDAGLSIRDGCGNTANEAACTTSFNMFPPPGHIASMSHVEHFVSENETIYLIVDGFHVDEYGEFLLMVDEPVVCGDGKHRGFESCDDGNLISGDGCSADCVIENREPTHDNSTIGQASPLPVGVPVQGGLNVNPAYADIDFWSFTANAGSTYIIQTATRYTGECDRRYSDTHLDVYNSSGALLAANGDISPDIVCSKIEFTAPASSQYFVKVELERFNPPMMGDTIGYPTGVSYSLSVIPQP